MDLPYIDTHIETPRLLLLPPNEVNRKRLLSFTLENRKFFALWEPKRDESYYTLSSMGTLLRGQWKSQREAQGLFTYLTFPSSTQIIGTVSLSNIVYGPFCSTFVGYKLAQEFNGQGYMREALQKVIEVGMNVYNLHRFEANIIPRNIRSKKLVQSLGFKCEGYSPQYLQIDGQWEGHEHYVYIVPDWQKV